MKKKSGKCYLLNCFNPHILTRHTTTCYLTYFPIWIVHADGASNKQGSGAGVLLITPEGDILDTALRFHFHANNNEAEYEAIIAGLRITNDMGADQVVVYNDSSVVVGQILGSSATKEDHLAAYLSKVQSKIKIFKKLNLY